MTNTPLESWDSFQAYEQYVGRWSRQVAGLFMRWLAPSPGLAWGQGNVSALERFSSRLPSLPMTISGELFLQFDIQIFKLILMLVS
jgi:hypothetical protein